MSHFAKIENGLVTQVIVAEQDFINLLEGNWVQTSYNTKGNQHLFGGTPMRGNYAGIGYTYDLLNDVFIAPQPYASWVLDNATWVWQAPTPMPTDGKTYGWDETNLTWVEA